MPQNKETFKDKARRALDKNDASLAFDLVAELDTLIEATPDEDVKMLKAYKAVRARLMIVAMRYYSVPTLTKLFGESLVAILSMPDSVSVKDNLRFRLLLEDYSEERNEIRDKLKAALEKSQDQLGNTPIMLGTEEVKPTIENWIKVITSELGTGKFTSVKLARFYTQNRNASKLSAVDLAILKQLVAFYEYLKARSEDLEGYEDRKLIETIDGDLIVVGDGQIASVYDEPTLKALENRAKKDELTIMELVDLQMRYPDRFSKYKPKHVKLDVALGAQPGMMEERAVQFFKDKEAKYALMEFKPMPLSQQQITEFINILPKARKEDLKKIKMNLAQVVNKKEEFVAFMRKGDIGDLIKREFPKELGEKNKAVIQQSIYSPLAFQALLQIVLLQKMGISEDEALWHAFEIVQKFPMTLKDFKTLVTFDVTKNKLVWRY